MKRERERVREKERERERNFPLSVLATYLLCEDMAINFILETGCLQGLTIKNKKGKSIFLTNF